MTKIKKIIRANYQPILFVFLAFLAMVLVSYFYVSSIVRNLMGAIGEEIMNTTQASVTANLSETELSFTNIARTVESMLASGKTNKEILQFLVDINNYFAGKRSSLPDFMKIYGYIRNEFIDGSGWVPPSDYEPTKRPWYIGADKNGGKVFFSEPYIDAETGGICISFSQKLFDQNAYPRGILSIDLKLSRITDYVTHQQISNNGYGVLISDTMNFTAHRDKFLISTNISDAGGDYPKLVDMFNKGEQISALRFTDADGTDSIVFFRTIFNGWHIGVIIPRANYYKQVYVLAFVLSILGFVLMTTLSYILIRTRVAKMRSDEESKSKSNFLARMSHEMRTPMNAIIGMANIAQNSSDIEKIQYCIGKIKNASNHLLGVINDVLDMSKIEAGKLELSETEFHFKDMLQQIIDVNNFKMEEKHQNFNINIDADVPQNIIADRQLLAQVITNLLSNASKFTPERGNISMAIHKLEEKNNCCILQFEITDDGIGISAEQQLKLFRSFEQADGSISRKYGGTGLGLAISKKIIEMMNGNISVKSEFGKGSTFIFTITAGISATLNNVNIQPSVSLSKTEDLKFIFAGKRILLAEDIEINREILIALLDGTGVEIVTAENGREAYELFAENPDSYDIIFMDIHMPEVDGYEATRRIRKMNFPKANTIPIIAMTANVFREDIEKCREAGMNDHIGKPIEIDEVIRKMKQYLSV